LHTLAFLDPGHFHAALTLRERHPRVHDEIFVYAPEGAEVTEFLKLVDAFNRRRERPTEWRPVVRVGDRSVERLIADRPADAVILAGKNDRKVGLMRQVHDAGFHVLADKPWITSPDALPDVRHVLSGGPIAMEIMTGRHEVTSMVADRLVREPDVFGDFDKREGSPSIRLASTHHLEKSVNGALLRRPAWYFDVRVQGDGLADIPTHLVAQAQRLLEHHGRADRELELLGTRRWPTIVPRALFGRITGLGEFPSDLRDHVAGDTLRYFCNAELSFRLRGVEVHVTTRWDLSEPPGSGDIHSTIIAGTAVKVHVEQGLHTGARRRVVVEPRSDATRVGDALAKALAAWQDDLPGLSVMPALRGFEVEIPDHLRTGHESHFPLVLDDFLTSVERGTWPDERAAATLAKYELLARALASANAAARP
jgi:predicted dehydrogenase